MRLGRSAWFTTGKSNDAVLTGSPVANVTLTDATVAARKQAGTPAEGLPPAPVPYATPSPGRTRPRLEHLDGVRALAALYVVGHHIWITTWPQYPRNTGPVWVGWLVYGHLAVSVFIVVSGFSLAIAPARHEWALQGGWLTFLRRRAWRILPTYWAALALSCVVFGVITADVTSDRVSLKAIIVHGLLLQDVVDSPKPNGAFWSIAVEWQIYFLFPLILWVQRRFGPRALLAVATIGVVGGYLLATGWGPAARLLNLTPQFALLFVFGVLAARTLQADPSRRRVRGLQAGGVGAAALFVLVCVMFGSVWIDEQYFWVDLLVGGGTAVYLAALASSHPPRSRSLLASWPLQRLGMFSYSIYCVHLPVLWLVWHFGISHLPYGRTGLFLALTGVGLPAVVLFSWLFSLLFEKPFLTRRSWAAWKKAWYPVSARRRGA